MFKEIPKDAINRCILVNNFGNSNIKKLTAKAKSFSSFYAILLGFFSLASEFLHTEMFICRTL